jgi:ankyrin repeat protein
MIALILLFSCSKPAEKDIFVCAEKGDIAGMKLLIEKGTNVNKVNPANYSILFVAITNGNAEAVEFLISKGANISNRIVNTTPLMLAAECNQTQIIVILADKGVKLDDSNGIRTALISAVEKGNLAAVKALAEKGANINLKNNLNWTALMFAVKYDHLEIAKYLISMKADLKAKDYFDDRTALIIAVENNNPEMVKLLIKSGAEVNQPMKDASGKKMMYYTPLDVAQKKGLKKIADLLVGYGAASSTINADTDSKTE